MRYLSYVIIGVLLVLLVTLSVANMQPVTLRLLPDDLMDIMSYQQSVTVPVFVVVWAAMAVGLGMGYVIEWFREMRIRSAAARQARELKKLEREVKRVKGQRDEGKDEILALVDENS